MYDIIKIKVRGWIRPLIMAIIVVIGGLAIWCSTTFQGKLCVEKMTGQYIAPPITHTIQVYSAGQLIGEYSGHYSVQQFEDHIVLINHDKKHDKTEIYGNTAVIVDEDD